MSRVTARNAPGSSPALARGLTPRVLLLLAVGVVAVSLSGPVMAGLAVGPLAVAFWRNAMATALLAPFAVAEGASGLRGADARQRWLVVAAGLCLAGHFGLWVPSLTMTSVASATAIVCLQVVWVVLWDRLTGTPVGVRVVLGVAVALAGALVVTGVDLTLSREALLGDLLALLGGVSVAAYTVIGGRARQSMSTTAYTTGCYGTAALVLLVVTLVSGQGLTGYAADQWALLGLVALTSQLLGHSVFNHLLEVVSPMVVSLTLLLEIPGATLLAGLLLGQLPGPATFVGLALILAGMVVVVTHGPAPPDETPVG